MTTLSSAAQDGKAQTTKKTFSRETTVSIVIEADAAFIWTLLIHGSDYPRWNSTVTSFKGEITEGGKIELMTILDAKRSFKLKVQDVQPEKRMVWKGGMGARTYTLTPAGEGKVAFTMTEKIGGFMFPLLAGMIPPFDEVFEKFAGDLKKEAEAIQATP